MRSDMLSKRIFFAGCFGLPWLWTVHCLFHWNSTQGCCSSSSSKSGDATADPQISSDNDDGDQQDNNDTNDETLLNPDDHFAADAMQSLTPDEIRAAVRKWVRRCQTGATVGWSVFVAWVVTAQVLRGSVFPYHWYMFNPEDAALTGW